MSDQDRQQINKYAREVLSGSQVVLGQRPATPSASAPRATAAIGSGLSAPRTMFIFCLAFLTTIALIVYAISGFGTASLIFFIRRLVRMSGRFVF
ncbi:hypothetical protein BH09CHL1_BH09CHL1_32170 [soil metagenome]